MRIERLPLNALRAFYQAAKEQSFKRAAVQLNVTPGAISRQVKQLEQRLGVALFERQANGVVVNPAGQLLAAEVEAGLLRIASGVEQATQRPGEHFELLISAPPSFLQLWLLPRLAAFEESEPLIRISLDADARLTPSSWRSSRAKLSLRYGRPPWPGVNSAPLCQDVLYPVCSPELLKTQHIKAPEDLLFQTLLTVDWCTSNSDGATGWPEWFHQAGKPQPALPQQRRYSLYSMALDQAIAGHGVVLASYPLIVDRLESGVLVRPFGELYPLVSGLSYALILPINEKAPPAVERFHQWLIAQAASLDTNAP
ncbi:LysR substrate-binding domain-containing protein [Halomonas dongshanensis]|uniref:LysR family transcriptional regulator n=1 Tax=Halomonas dongshanensis TaxID=2890835 RepID=A0ABT2EAK7_9GAMM|nr:LysR substrate-binding domain-containing protein [Halomonas dongshanensis]MCS2608559.1 LysR family transcriptional regulator [Halomonas dongshanensis]